MDRLLARIFLNLIPAAVVVVSIYLAVAGEQGLFARHRIERDLERSSRQLAQVEAENTRLRREIDQLRNDPATRDRAATEELLLVPPGSTVYRFEE